MANSSKASLSCYIYCDLWQLMVILWIVYIIYCDFCNSFVIFIAIYGHLWQFCNNFQIFLMILLFTAFSLVIWGLQYIQIYRSAVQNNVVLPVPAATTTKNIVTQQASLKFASEHAEREEKWWHVFMNITIDISLPSDMLIDFFKILIRYPILLVMGITTRVV